MFATRYPAITLGPEEKTMLAVEGSVGLFSAPTELEGRYGLRLAQNG